MAFDAFLKIEGIDGESTRQGPQGRDRDLLVQLGRCEHRLGLGGGGGGAGKVSFQDFHFTMPISKASPNLMLACATGKHYPSAMLTCRKAGGSQVEFLKIKLADILVSSYRTGATRPQAGRLSGRQSLAQLRQDRLPLHGRSHGRDGANGVRPAPEQED